MIIRIENPKENPVSLMRRIGYSFQRNEGDEQSFVRILARAGYPRFHAYVRMENKVIVIKIHLDQKKETYGNNTRHHGEYEDEGALKIENERIQKMI